MEALTLQSGHCLAFINITLVVWVVNNNITHPLLVFSYVIVAGVLFQLLQGVIVVYARVAPIIVSLSGYLVLSGLNLVILKRAGWACSGSGWRHGGLERQFFHQCSSFC